MLRISIIILCTIFCNIFDDAAAQEMPHFIEKLTTENGLSSNNINDIVQDDNGFLWIATSDGLNRYDGTEVVQYFHTDKQSSLAHNYVYCLKKLPGNSLAVGTQAGLSFYDGNNGSCKNFYYKKNNSLDPYNNIIEHLETDANGNLWAASQNCLFVFDKNLKLKKVLASPFTKADAALERQHFAEKILPLSNGDVLLCLQYDWYIYSNKTNTLEAFKNTVYKKLEFLNSISPPHVEKYFTAAHVFKVYEKYFISIDAEKDSLYLFDENGKQLNAVFSPFNKYPYVLWSQKIVVIDSTKLLFLFHSYGFATISVAWKNNQPFFQSVSAMQFETNEYNNALKDQQNNWWLATLSEGLQKISPYKQYFTSATLINDETYRQSKYETVSCFRHDNTLWVATYGDGFFETDISTGKQQEHRFKNTGDDVWANYVWNFCLASNDTLWVGTQYGMFWYSVSSKKYGRLPAYPGKPAVLDSVPITIQFTDSHGLVWMGLGKGKGLCCFDSKSKRFNYYPGKNLKGYPFRYPLNIVEDKKNNLWFTNDASAQLVYWNRNTSQFKIVSLPASPQNQSINLYGLYCENDSILWLGTTTNGLIKFIPSKNFMEIYAHDKGLVNSHVSSIYEDDKKRLWLVTDGGISCFDTHTETFTNYAAKDGLPVSVPTAFFYFDSLSENLYSGGYGAYLSFHPDVVNTRQPPQKTIITAVYVNGVPYNFLKTEKVKFSSQQNDITIKYTAVDLTNGAETKYVYKLKGGDTNWIMAGNLRQINFSHLAPGSYTFMVRANNSGEWSGEAASVSFAIAAPFTQTVWFYALILIAIAVIFYSMYRYRLKQLMQTELVRSEISKNLHDEVGSNLTNISLSSLLAQQQLKNETVVSRLLDRIYQDSQTVSEAMREIVWSINPKIDTLGEALPRMLRYASELLEAKNIELHAAIASEVENVKLNMQRRRDVYLIFKEAVNNMAKHSEANKATIHFHLISNTLEMKISDDGKGFDILAPLINNGLKNMQERAKSHRWKLQIDSEITSGTTITLKVEIA